MKNKMNKVVAGQLVGDVWPSAQPGEDPVLYEEDVFESRTTNLSQLP